MIAPAKKTKPPGSVEIFLPNLLVTHDAPNDTTSAATLDLGHVSKSGRVQWKNSLNRSLARRCKHGQCDTVKFTVLIGWFIQGLLTINRWEKLLQEGSHGRHTTYIYIGIKNHICYNQTKHINTHSWNVRERRINNGKKKHIVLYCGSWMLAYLRYQYRNQKSNPPWQGQCKLPTHREWFLQGNSF